MGIRNYSHLFVHPCLGPKFPSRPGADPWRKVEIVGHVRYGLCPELVQPCLVHLGVLAFKVTLKIFIWMRFSGIPNKKSRVLKTPRLNYIFEEKSCQENE